MAFTTISRIRLGVGDGGPEGHFYAQDIAVVLNQLSPTTGAQAISTQMFHATNLAGDKQFKALVAVTAVGGPGGSASELLTEDHHWVAISCPPYNHTGFEGTP
jgi:hypothetical protein